MSPTSYQAAPPRESNISACLHTVKQRNGDGKLRSDEIHISKPGTRARGKIYVMNKRRPPARAGAPKNMVSGAAKKVVHKAVQGDKTEQESREEVLLPLDKAEIALDVEGRKLKFTNLNKVFYPADGYKKRDVINFYAAVAGLLVPHLQGRPLSLKRYPNGIDRDYFFQKDASGFPDWLHREELADDEELKTRVICDDKASLLYLANLGCIDQNPYMSRMETLGHPDFILIDLDPYHCGYDRIVEAAQLVREKLQLIGLTGYPKTTGGNGMHVYVPVEPIYNSTQTRQFAEILARWVAAERPDLFTTPRMVSAREKSKVYFDYLQNASGKTISAPYVLRAHPRAPVATPLKWDEVVPGLKPTQFHIANVLRRFERVGDLFAGVLKKPQELGPALERLGKAME